MSIFTLALERQGFHVIGFTEPLLALDHFQKNSDVYWPVVADIRMPLLDGYQFIKRVKEVKPNVKVFLCQHFLPTIFNIELVKVDEYIEQPISLILMIIEKVFSDD